MKRQVTLAITLLVFISFTLFGCGNVKNEIIDPKHIIISDDKITINGNAITNDTSSDVYTANDIIYYPEGKDFTFGEATEQEMHSAASAQEHTVIHITKPGYYVLSGSLSKGQIAVDLGEDAKDDPEAVVTLVLNDLDITCEVAPAIIFYNVYECSSDDAETATKDVNTENAGANVIIADGSTNNITGSHVAKIYKSYELNEDKTEVIDSKKLHKYDGAFYSKMSMNIYGEKNDSGILNIISDNEGLDSELHLTINGGIINITSGNDGINTNEDNVSVTTVNGGKVNITVTGSTGEGDGIDSNGWLVINGGEVITSACSFSADAGIDSDMGIYINGGKIVSGGNMLDRISGTESTYAVFSMNSPQSGKISLRDEDGNIVYEADLINSFTQLIISDENMKEGTYYLYCGETMLAHSSQGNGRFPQNAEMPKDMNNTVPPDDSDRQRPEMPQGGFPEGTVKPDAPHLSDPQKNGPGNINTGEFSGEQIAEFTIKKGENYFSGISEYNKKAE